MLHVQMWACVPHMQGAGQALGGGRGPSGAPGVSRGVSACTLVPRPVLAGLGWLAGARSAGCPSSGLELGSSPGLTPDCEALGCVS